MIRQYSMDLSGWTDETSGSDVVKYFGLDLCKTGCSDVFRQGDLMTHDVMIDAHLFIRYVWCWSNVIVFL